jgi:hypothetical protein
MNTQLYECTVLLNTLDKVKKFIEIVNLSDVTIDALSEKYIVDGKSILGLFSLNLMDPLKLKISGKQSDIRDLVAEISEYMV